MAYNYSFNPQMAVQQGIPQPISTQNVQPLFPQPQGNVYNINSTLEVANVPVGAGISVALCLPENLMYIKTMQNGNPLFYSYKIQPFTAENPQEKENLNSDLVVQMTEQIKDCNSRITNLEEKLLKREKTKGDDWNI